MPPWALRHAWKCYIFYHSVLRSYSHLIEIYGCLVLQSSTGIQRFSPRQTSLYFPSPQIPNQVKISSSVGYQKTDNNDAMIFFSRIMYVSSLCYGSQHNYKCNWRDRWPLWWFLPICVWGLDEKTPHPKRAVAMGDLWRHVATKSSHP